MTRDELHVLAHQHGIYFVPGGDEDAFAAALTAQPAAIAVVEWMLIESAPQSESVSFLLFVPGKSDGNASEGLVVQVSRFEGNFYPDVMDCNVDWYDRVTRATHWMPLPTPPEGAQR